MDNSTAVNLQMATPPPLPPGITDINALSKMNMDRLPDHMRVFLNQHFLKGDKNKQEESNPSVVTEGDESNRKVSENSKEESQEDVKKKSKKVKLVPKPPAGPPPPSAFQSKAL